MKCPECGGELVKLWKNASRHECRNPTCAVIEVRVVGKGDEKKFIVLRTPSCRNVHHSGLPGDGR